MDIDSAGVERCSKCGENFLLDLYGSLEDYSKNVKQKLVKNHQIDHAENLSKPKCRVDSRSLETSYICNTCLEEE